MTREGGTYFVGKYLLLHGLIEVERPISETTESDRPDVSGQAVWGDLVS